MPNDFDIAALEYDTNFTFSKIGRAQRQMVYKHLNPLLNTKKKCSILEINCGTGEDAIYLAKQGHHVLATDISEEMIHAANSKKIPKTLVFKTLDINTISKDTFDNKFDLIFSNFGGLNCLSKAQLKSFFETSIHLLNPKGKFIVVVMPKHCLWERFYFSLKGDIKKAKRRNTDTFVLANVEGVSVNTWYYNPQEIITLTKRLFTVKAIKPIGIAIPPSYLEGSFLSEKYFLNFLNFFEKKLRQPFWAKYADHFLIELEKR